MKKIVGVALILGFLTACNQNSDKPEAKDSTSTQVTEPTQQGTPTAPVADQPKSSSWKGIVKMSDKDFSQQMATAPGLTVVDFSADWCGPCKKLYPIIEKLAQQMEGKVNFGNVDVDESPKIAQALSISSIPLLVFYKDGKIVDKLVGLLPEAELKAKISQHL